MKCPQCDDGWVEYRHPQDPTGYWLRHCRLCRGSGNVTDRVAETFEPPPNDSDAPFLRVVPPATDSGLPPAMAMAWAEARRSLGDQDKHGPHYNHPQCRADTFTLIRCAKEMMRAKSDDEPI